MKTVGPNELHSILKRYAPKLLANDRWREDMNAVSKIITFKTTTHVVENLIDWNNVPNDPVFQLTFPQADMLPDKIKDQVKDLLKATTPGSAEFQKGLFKIGHQLNPHPAAQHINTPKLVTPEGIIKVRGLQHKYKETCLYFFKPAQHCFANCTYCFRWPQLIGFEPFENHNPTELFDYVKQKPMLSDVLFTGGDPGVLPYQYWEKLLLPFIEGDRVDELSHIKNFRIGTKGLTYWPQRWCQDEDSSKLLKLFERVGKTGRTVNFMCHLSHPNELDCEITAKAVKNLRNVGVILRSQSPLVKHINDSAEAWAKKWNKEVSMGIVPYYMFVERDTGPKSYFEVPLARCLEIYNNAITNVGGLCKTVKGPSMSCTPGKVKVVGIDEIAGEKVFILQFLQARNPEWGKRLFYAKYDPEASWFDDLKPAFGAKKFFFEDELQLYLEEKKFW